MKRFFAFFIICLPFVSCRTSIDSVSCMGTDNKVHPFASDVCAVYVGFSSTGCHDCHQMLNAYLEEINLYNNDTIEVYGIIALEKDKIRNKLSQQLAIASMKQYYPKMKQFRFCEKIDRNIKVFGKRLRDFDTPFVLRVYQNEYFFFESNWIFVQNENKMAVSDFFKDRLFQTASFVE